MPDLRILIVGGGIAGLTLANVLEEQSVAPLPVEREPRWSHRGYALALWPLGGRVLRGLGLFRAFTERSLALERYRILDGRRRLIHEITMRDHLAEADMIRMVKREDLLMLLADHLRRIRVEFNKAPEHIVQSTDEVEVQFTDGTRASFDLVVGCDGVRSDVRRMILGDVPARHTGWAGWAWWTRASEAPRDAVTEYWAPGRFLETYSTTEATSVLAAMPVDHMPEDRRHPRVETVRRHFAFFGGDVVRVLDALRPEEPIYYWDFEDVRCRRWYAGRVALLGDASSALLPSAGVSASCAMESAAVLADELRRVDTETVPQALPLYFARRFHRVERMQRESRLIGRLMFTSSRLVSAGRNAVLRTTPFADSRLKAMKRLLEEPV